MKDIPDQEDFRVALIQAEAGDVKAQSDIAYWYLQGTGVEQNSERAVYWYTKAAEAGDGHAQFMLAFRYKTGDGVGLNSAQALHWFEKASATDPSYSMHEVGLAYYEGEGAVQDYKKAAQCFKKAYEAGNVHAAYYYARCLLTGSGLDENIQLGITCLQSAAKQDHEDAKKLLNIIAEEAGADPLVAATMVGVAGQTPEMSSTEIRAEWKTYQSANIRLRMRLLKKFTDAIISSNEKLTSDIAALYIEILKKAAQVPEFNEAATKMLSRLMPEYLVLTARRQVHIIDEITSHELGIGTYTIGDPVYLKELSQWSNQRTNHHLVEMMNAGKIIAFTTKNGRLGTARLRLVDGDEPVLSQEEYKEFRSSSPTVIIKIESEKIGIYLWKNVAVQMTLELGNYKICGYHLSDDANFYIVMCKTDLPAKNNFEVLPDLSS